MAGLARANKRTLSFYSFMEKHLLVGKPSTNRTLVDNELKEAVQGTQKKTDEAVKQFCVQLVPVLKRKMFRFGFAAHNASFEMCDV